MRNTARAAISSLLLLVGSAWAEQGRIPVPKGYLVARVYPSASGYAFTAEKGGKYWVFQKDSGGIGAGIGPYDSVGAGAWSPDGSAFAYLAKAGGASRVYSGGAAISPESAEILSFSWPKGRSAPFFSTKEDGQSFYYYDGSREGPYAAVKAISGGAGPSQELAVWATLPGQGGAYIEYRGRKIGPLYGVQGVYLSRNDGGVLSYIAYDGGLKGQCVYLGTKRFGPYPRIREAMISPTGDSVAYFLNGAGSIDLYQDGRKLASYRDGYVIPSWSSDGKTLGYYSYEDSGKYFHAGDLSLGPFEDAHSMSLSSDGKAACSVKEGGAWYIYDGATRKGPYPSKAFSLRYNPDGSALAATINDGKAAQVYVGEKSLGKLAQNAISLDWSPDGKTLSFLEDSGNGSPVLHVGGAKFSGFHNIYTSWWSDDGSTLEFSTTLIRSDEDRNFTKIFLDGKMLTGGVDGDRVVYVDGNDLVER